MDAPPDHSNEDLSKETIYSSRAQKHHQKNLEDLLKTRLLASPIGWGLRICSPLKFHRMLMLPVRGLHFGNPRFTELRIQGLWSPYTMEYYSAVKTNRVLTHATM